MDTECEKEGRVQVFSPGKKDGELGRSEEGPIRSILATLS